MERAEEVIQNVEERLEIGLSDSPDSPVLRGAANVEELQQLVHGSHNMVKEIYDFIIQRAAKIEGQAQGQAQSSAGARQAVLNNMAFATPIGIRVLDSLGQAAVASIEDGTLTRRPQFSCPTRQDIKNCPANFASCCFSNRYRILAFCCSLPCYALACIVIYQQLRAFFTSPPFVKN